MKFSVYYKKSNDFITNTTTPMTLQNVRKGWLAATVLLLASLGAHAEWVEDFTCQDGWIYSGEIRNGLRNGEGAAVTLKGNVYYGKWVNDLLPEGKLESYQDGNEWIYEGAFNKKFQPNGFGCIRYLKGQFAGDTYYGQFQDGVKQGIGKWVHKNGTIEFGNWASGKLSLPDGQNFKAGDKVYGIDLSHHNTVDWDRLALYADKNGEVYKLKPTTKKYLQPVSFAYARATAGATIQDSLYLDHRAQAKKHGVPIGSYHVLYLTTSSLDEQLANFLRETNNCKTDELPPMIDIECLDQAKKVGRAKTTEMLLEMCKKVQKATGRKPIIYTNDRFANNYLDMSKLKGYTFWKAAYGKNSSQEKKEPEQPWKIWQFTEKGNISGISPVDINVYDGNLKDFNKQFVKK